MWPESPWGSLHLCRNEQRCADTKLQHSHSAAWVGVQDSLGRGVSPWLRCRGCTLLLISWNESCLHCCAFWELQDSHVPLAWCQSCGCTRLDTDTQNPGISNNPVPPARGLRCSLCSEGPCVPAVTSPGRTGAAPHRGISTSCSCHAAASCASSG